MSSRSIKWTDFPEKQVFSIEYSGEASYGKTHNCFTFPNVALCDTIGEGKGWIIAQKMNNLKYFQASEFDDIKRFVDYCVTNPKIDTIAIDSGSDLLQMAETEWLRKKGRTSVYVPGQGGFQWAQVYKKIDDLISAVKKAKKYLVVTSRMKDEWVSKKGETEDVKTGNRVRSGYKKFGFGLTVLLELTYGIKDADDNVHFEGHIFGRCIKNGFFHKRVQKPFIFDPTYQGLVEEGELFTPWCGAYDKEKCDLNTCAKCKRFVAKDVMEEAKKYLISIGTLQEVKPIEKAK